MNLFETLFQELLLEGVGPISKPGDIKRGTKNERRFDHIMQNWEITSTPASPQEDYIDHFDRHINQKPEDSTDLSFLFGSKKSLKVEVKGFKPGPKNSIMVELIASGGRHPGWLYSKGDYISFDFPSEKKLLFFNIPELRKYVESKGEFTVKSRGNNAQIVPTNPSRQILQTRNPNEAFLNVAHNGKQYTIYYKRPLEYIDGKPRGDDAVTYIPKDELMAHVDTIPVDYSFVEFPADLKA